MSVYTSFAANVLFPLHERVKKHSTVAVRRELERTQWLGPGQIRALQLQRLRAFLSECAVHVPYYRDLFRSLDFDPARIAGIGDLMRLPLLTKDIVRREFDRLCSDAPEPLRLFSTTGSTGDPLRFKISKTRISHEVAAKWRATRWWGVDIGDRESVIWSSPIELTRQDRLRRVRDWFLRSKLLSSESMSPADMDRYISEIRRFRPTMLYGYPSSMTLIAQRAEQQKIRLDDLGIRVAFWYCRALVSASDPAVAAGIGLSGRRWLWRPRFGLHRQCVPARRLSYHCRGHRRGDRRSRGPPAAARRAG